MPERLIDIIFKNSQAGLSGLFLALAVFMFIYLRKDTEDHRKEYKEVIDTLFRIVDKNTQANTRLADSINDLKDRIKNV